MKKISRRSFLAASGILAATAALTACGGGSTSGSTASNTTSTTKGEHEPISICTPFRDINGFIEVVHKHYPEINFDVIPYSGNNGTAFMQAQLRSGDMPDVYTASVYATGLLGEQDKLLDLSSYDFTNNYVPARLHEVMLDNGIYLLPSYFSCIGITYNKKILADNGWELPTSLKELEELAPKAREAGYNVFLNQIQYPGYGFQYLCNILDTGYFSTLGGREWQNKYLNGEATFAGTPEIMENMQLLQRWRDLGFLNDDMGLASDNDVAEEMYKGNTLFMLGATNDFTKFGGDNKDFGLMPYLSEDGEQNVFILNVTRFTGLNKKLEEPGNEQKLEDALHVMEIMSTVEGLDALNTNYRNTSLAPLKDAPVVEGNYYQDILEQVNAGYTAPFVYAGWDNAIVADGNEMISFIRGEVDLDHVITTLDENQKLITDNSSQVITTATEPISTEDCARLVGIVFTKASGADFALISMDQWFPENHGDGNRDGVSGKLFALPVTEQEITCFLPTGWRSDIETYTFTGKRIKELLDTGYNYKDQGFFYPYQLVAKDGFTIDDNTTYTVVITGATDAVKEEGNVQDTGILGLTAMDDYMGQFDSFSAQDIRWE